MQWNKSILLGCTLIALALIIGAVSAANTVGDKIAWNLGAAASHVPGSFTVHSGDQAGSEYLSEWEAAVYIRLDYDAFVKMLDQGKLNGTYVEFAVEKLVYDEEAYQTLSPVQEGNATPPVETAAPPVIRVPGVERVFVRTKLDEWMLGQITPQ